MPVRRDADGNIINKRTRLIRPSEVDPGGQDETVALHTRRIARPTEERSSAPTKPVRGREVAPDDSRTRIYRPVRPDAGTGDDTGSAVRSAPAKPVRGRKVDPAADDPMVDPVVGWLVIIAGPGQGGVVTLGMGVNSMGRDRTERVSLDYGDAMISRTNHCAISYDPRSRKFYVQHGGGINLTYANEEPVLALRELEPATHLQLGNTVLRFVPLCGEGFSWDEETERD